MKAIDLKIGMKYFFLPNFFKLEDLQKDQMFTIEKINKNAFYNNIISIESDGGCIARRDFEKIWIYDKEYDGYVRVDNE